MSEEVTVRRTGSVSDAPAEARGGFWLDRMARVFAGTSVPFEMVFPDGKARRFGQGTPSFSVRLNNRNAVRAITSLDQVKFADAYLAGDIDIDGDMLRPFELRQSLGDRHPLTTVWRFLQPLLFGQVRTNQAAITSHYDIDPRVLPELPGSQDPLLHAGRLRECHRNTGCRDHPEVRLLLREAGVEARRPYSRDRAGVGRLVRIRIAPRHQVHWDQHLADVDRLSQAAGAGARARLGTDQRRSVGLPDGSEI